MQSKTRKAAKLLTTRQAGEILGLTTRAMEERRRRGDGPLYIRLSATTVRYDPEDLQAFLDARRFTSTAEEAAQETEAGG